MPYTVHSIARRNNIKNNIKADETNSVKRTSHGLAPSIEFIFQRTPEIFLSLFHYTIRIDVGKEGQLVEKRRCRTIYDPERAKLLRRRCVMLSRDNSGFVERPSSRQPTNTELRISEAPVVPWVPTYSTLRRCPAERTRGYIYISLSHTHTHTCVHTHTRRNTVHRRCTIMLPQDAVSALTGVSIKILAYHPA